MKKIALISLCLASFLHASGSTEDFFYEKGYENGYNKGFEAGVKAAFSEAKNVLNKYAQHLKAYEIGKYLQLKGYITYPQIWQEKTGDGGMRLALSPSRIERPLDVDELFARFSTMPLRDANAEKSLELSVEQRNSVYLSNRDSNANELPQNVDEGVKTITQRIKKSGKNQKILKEANVVFSDEGEYYNVLFFTNTEKAQFCKDYSICGER